MSDTKTQKTDLISLAEAAKISGYTQDYLGWLCRHEKLVGQKIGRNWVVAREDLDALLSKSTTTDIAEDASSQLEEPTNLSTDETVEAPDFSGAEISIIDSVVEPDSSTTDVAEETASLSVDRKNDLAVDAPQDLQDDQVNTLDLNILDGLNVEQFSFLPALPIISAEEGDRELIVEEMIPASSSPKNENKKSFQKFFSLPGLYLLRGAIAAFCFLIFSTLINFTPALLTSWTGSQNKNIFHQDIFADNFSSESGLVFEGGDGQEILSSGDNIGGEVLAAKTTSTNIFPSIVTSSNINSFIDERILNQLIAQQIQNLASIGLLKGPKGDTGPVGPSGTTVNGQAAAPIQYYVPQNPTPTNFGGSMLLYFFGSITSSNKDL
jgi:hypothetical protein